MYLHYTVADACTCEQQQAAATTVYCATSNDLQSLSGYYFNNCFQCPPSPEATNPTTAKWLWELSEQMITRAKTLTSKPTVYDVWEFWSVRHSYIPAVLQTLTRWLFTVFLLALDSLLQNCLCTIIIIIIFFGPWYFIPRVWDIKQSVWCLERLQWGLGNCESVRQADCVQTLDCTIFNFDMTTHFIFI